jgi:hypothetical protein
MTPGADFDKARATDIIGAMGPLAPTSFFVILNLFQDPPFNPGTAP